MNGSTPVAFFNFTVSISFGFTGFISLIFAPITSSKNRGIAVIGLLIIKTAVHYR
jgi:hypothetical protein